jgi:hypothetical protein
MYQTATVNIYATQRDPSLKFICPVCEAAPQERCHVNDRVICFESHSERRDLAMTQNDEVASQEILLPRKWRAS